MKLVLFLFGLMLVGGCDAGRYTAISGLQNTFIYVLDTRTGLVKACFTANVNVAPKCTDWSSESFDSDKAPPK